MGRPIIGRPPARPAKVQAPLIPLGETAQNNQALEAAKSAVAEFDQQYQVLQEMRKDWETNFPEALQALNEVKRQEDEVLRAIKRAKPLVAECKTTIGDFYAQRKWESAHYDEKELTRILALTEAAPQIVLDMLNAGILEGISLSKDASLGWFAQHPNYAEIFQEAFKPETEMSTAVTVPKI